ncbi:AMP-binding protein, partial [Candidatus Dojkabacteria bacterium]|nr:AMP-binding protein [Candidatus Dojkabacteria bacterium]
MKRLESVTTFRELIELVADEYGDRVAMQIRRRIRNEQYKYKDLPLIVNKISNFLEKQGIGRDERIFVWGLNCPEYVLLLLAIFASRRVAVPIDFRTNNDTIEKIVEQTKPKAAFVSMLVDNKFVKSKFQKVFHLEELMDLVEQESPEYKIPKAKKGEDEKYCEILYTSGTTGVPKGVVMKETNIIEMAKVAQNHIPKLKDYRTISMLPLSHVFEQILGTAVALSLGSSTTYLTRTNSAKMKKAMQDVKPTYMVFVPQLLSLFWQRIEQTAKSEGKMELIEKMMSLSAKLPNPIRKKIFKKVHANFGGSIEFIAVSGAPLNPDLAQKYVDMGFRILEVYGATEILASNINDSKKYGLGHVGPAVETVDMKLDENKEIWIKSPYTTPGYFENPEKNAETFKDGWYKTGD